MSYIVSSIKNIRTIKALRGESLTIDLGKVYDGTLTAWMKKGVTSPYYRSFEIRDNRYLFLPKIKTKDYFTDAGVLIESIAGRWYFDVELVETGEEEDTSKTIYTGTILFLDDMTGSNSVEITDPNTTPGVRTFIGLRDTPDSFGNAGQIPVINPAGDGLIWADPASGGVQSFIGLSDTPSTYGAPGQFASMNPAGNALIWVDAPTGGATSFSDLSDTPDNLGTPGQLATINPAGDAIIWSDKVLQVIASNLAAGLEIPTDWYQRVAGLTINDVNDLNLTEITELIYFPEVQAYIGVTKSFAISGQTTANTEVGTIVPQAVNVVFNQGEIRNGDDSLAGPLVGVATNIRLRDPASVLKDEDTSGNTATVNDAGYEISFGNNTWTIEVINSVGTTTYESNKQDPTPIPAIEAAKASTTSPLQSFTLSGRYNRWYYVGPENTSPTNSVGVRALDTDELLSSTNTGIISIPVGAGPGFVETSFYIPTGKTVTVNDVANLNLDITTEFTQTPITINDAAGNGTSYVHWSRFAGALGYENPTTHLVTIT